MESSSIKLEYNINGIGVITPVICKFPGILYENELLNIEKKLKNTNQLGVIRYIHQGAHYTRYEYVLLQCMLINFIHKNGGSRLGLGSKFSFDNWQIDQEIKSNLKITRVELLQLIVLCANMGHFKDTFSSNKVWFHIILENSNGIQRGLKRGLSSESIKILNSLIDTSDYQKLHLINSLYMLNRRKNLEEFRVLCEKFVRNLLSNYNDREMDLYQKIRKVAYIVLDSHFSHIPIEINLQSVLFNQNLFIDEVLKNNSNLFGTLERVNELLEDTLYLENNVLLMGTYRSLVIYKKVDEFFSKNTDLGDASKVNKLIMDYEESPFYEEPNIEEYEVPWNKEKNLSITFSVMDRSAFPRDVFKKELEVSSKLGSNCFVGFNFSPSYKKYRTVYALKGNLEGKQLLNNCLRIISQVAEDYLELKDFSHQEVNNGPLIDVVTKKIITYLFRNILREDYFCDYSYSNNIRPFILAKGTKNALKILDLYIEKFIEIFPNDKDGLHEIKMLKERLSNIKYKGLTIVYAGSLRFINRDRKSVCELDGLILTPNNKEKFLEVIEAKNIQQKSQRTTVAYKQLQEKFLPLINHCLKDSVEIEEINQYGAMVTLKR